jgi:MFS family permease
MEHNRPFPKSEFWIATCGGLLLLVSWGLAYSMPVMFPRLAEYFAVPVWHFAACFSVGGAMYFAIGGLTGAMADRYGTPVVVTLGLLTCAAGFLVASVAGSEAIFAAGYIIAVGAGVGLTYAPVTAAVQVLCTRDKIIAAGIASSGIGFGSLLLPPLVAWLYRTWDWRSALQMMAVLAVLGILPVLSLRRVVETAPAVTATSNLRSNPRFVMAFVAQVLFAIVAFVPFAHLVSIALKNGWSATEGVELISIVGLGSTVGRFLVVPIAQRLGTLQTASLLAYVMALTLAALALVQVHWAIWADMTLFGLSYGGIIALTAPIVAEICGHANVGRNVGTLISARAVGVLLGPWAVGLATWWLGAYTWPLIACALVGVMAGICMERCAVEETAAVIAS